MLTSIAGPQAKKETSQLKVVVVCVEGVVQIVVRHRIIRKGRGEKNRKKESLGLRMR